MDARLQEMIDEMKKERDKYWKAYNVSKGIRAQVHLRCFMVITEEIEKMIKDS
jgi:hypothetical protein